MATTAIEKTERTLADLRNELWSGTNELFSQFLASISEQLELTPEQQATVSDYLSGSIEKRDQLADFIKALEEEAARLREREKQIAARRHDFEKVAGLFRSNILLAMQNSPNGVIVHRVDGHESSFRVRKNPPAVEIYDEAAIPGEYINYPPQYDKRKIADDLKDGKEVPGARWSEARWSLDIR